MISSVFLKITITDFVTDDGWEKLAKVGSRNEKGVTKMVTPQLEIDLFAAP
jgi:hypothetical protein